MAKRGLRKGEPRRTRDALLSAPRSANPSVTRAGETSRNTKRAFHRNGALTLNPCKGGAYTVSYFWAALELQHALHRNTTLMTTSLLNLIARFVGDESGSTFIEFTTVMAVICSMLTFVVWIYGQNVAAAECSFGNVINGVTAQPLDGACGPVGERPAS
jgi:Flp pilus assembly pilin Flp